MPETLSYQITPNCPIGADVRHGEVVFFQADAESADAAPQGIFEMRGAIDDDFVEDDWYYFVGDVAGSVLAVGTYMRYSASLDDLVSVTIATIGIVVALLALGLACPSSKPSPTFTMRALFCLRI